LCTESRNKIGAAASALLEVDENRQVCGSEVVFWAPNGGDLQKLLATFWKTSCESAHPRVLNLIFPLPRHLSGLNVTQLKDLWKNPILNNNWGQLLQKFVVSETAVRLVCPTKMAPTVCWKQVGIATLAVAELMQVEEDCRMSQAILIKDRDIGFYADCAGKDVGKIRRSLARVLGKMTCSIAPPERSPGHTKDFPRVRFHVSFPAEAVSQYDLEGLLRNIRGHAGEVGLLLARDCIMEEGRALLIEVTHTTAIDEALPLCSDAMWLDGGTALVLTDHLPNRWESMLCSQFEAHPEEIITTVKPRASVSEKAWATCPTTVKHARAMAKKISGHASTKGC